jgi:2-oxoglutarate ferredoxin oxidoreductase subunit beta
MFGLKIQNLVDCDHEYITLEEYEGAVPRWCVGCGDNAILTATQKLLRDEQLPPEKVVFVSGIGCASRFPHYLSTYGFHGLHGRALPTAQGIKIRRPDLKVFVNMGDGDCCSIGTAHWIHSIRYNIDMVAVLHDNHVYGLTKKQVSPTTPKGFITNTTPKGAPLDAINPVSATLGVTNVSFVAQVVEWVPDLLYEVIHQAYHHKGVSFIRIWQRCPHYLPDMYAPFMSNPENILLLTHENGLQVGEALGRVFKTQEEHDPSNINRAREIAEFEEKLPVGILYRNENVPCYDDIKKPERVPTAEQRRTTLDKAFDTFGIFPRSS